MFIKHDYDILCVRIVCSIKFSLYSFSLVGGLSLRLLNTTIKECCEVVIQYEQNV